MIQAAALAGLPWAKIAALCAVLAAAGAGVAWHVHRVDLARAQGYSAGKAEVQVDWDTATMLAQREALREDLARRKREQQDRAAIDREIEHAHQATLALAGDRDRARDESRRLHDAAKATAARCRAGAAGSATAASGSAAAGPGDLLAGVLDELERAGRALAEEADRRGSAGASCVRIYEALTTKTH